MIGFCRGPIRRRCERCRNSVDGIHDFDEDVGENTNERPQGYFQRVLDFSEINRVYTQYENWL